MQRLVAHDLLFPEETAQDGVGIEREQLVARERGGQHRDAAVVFVAADVVFVARTAEVAGAFHRQPLDQQARGHFVIGGEHELGVELLRLQHVVLEHLAQAVQRLAVVAMQRHHALIGLLARQLLARVERDGAAALAVDVHERVEPWHGRHLTRHLGRHAEGEVRFHFGHRQLHRPFAVDLHHDRTIELDVRLHQHARRGHFAEQLAHRRREGILRRLTACQHLAPVTRQPHQQAAHRQPVKQKLVEFAHQPIFFSPAL